MESLGILRSLWRHPIGVAFGVLLSIAAGLFSFYDVSVSPPGLQSRDAVLGYAQEHVLVDTSTSLLVDAEAPGAESIAIRSIILSNLLQGRDAKEMMARRAGIRPDDIDVVGLGSSRADLGTPLSDQATEVVKSEAPYLVLVNEGPSLPILSILVIAPRRAGAARLAKAATETLGYLGESAPEVGANLKIKRLGQGNSWARATETSKLKALIAASTVFLAWFGMVVAYDRLRRRGSPEGWAQNQGAWG
jgi:hypothetical protein